MLSMGICRYVYCLCIMYVYTYQVSGNQLQSEERYRRELGNDRCVVLQTRIGGNETNFTNKNRQVIYEYRYPLVIKTTAFRVTVAVLKASKDNPVLFVVRQQHGIMSWKVPFKREHIYTYNVVSRNLCPFPVTNKDSSAKNQTIFVDVYSFSINRLTFTIHVDLVKDFNLRTDETRNVSITPSEPQYFMYTFPDNVDTVIVQAKSNSDCCMIFSLQDVKCPVFDLEQDVEFSGVHQTMTKRAAITVKKSNYDKKSFYIVMVLKPSDYACKNEETTQAPGCSRKKHLTLQVYNGISDETYILAILVPLVIYFLFYLFFLFGENFVQCMRNSKYCAYLCTSYTQLEGDNSNQDERQAGADIDQAADERQAGADIDQAADERQAGADIDQAAEPQKNHKEFFWNLFSIAIFYGLPVVQLVLIYQKELKSSGDQDICYYNFDCSRPLVVLSSFNNVFSNIGYVVLGILFLLVVWKSDRSREKKPGNQQQKTEEQMNRAKQENNSKDLLYAMGLGLVMEGIMSSCYHVCPSSSNFQFDTSFMYILTCLCMLKVFRSTFPVLRPTAYKSYPLMALVVLMAFIGVIYNTNFVWIIFGIIYLVVTLILNLYLNYIHDNTSEKTCCSFFKQIYKCCVFKKIYKCMQKKCDHTSKPQCIYRLVILIISTVLNSFLAIYGLVRQPSDFATSLLAIFLVNLLLNYAYYIFMKCKSNKKIDYGIITCGTIALIVWIFALWFFFSHLTSWELTPAQSREGNRSCILLDFYDAHDVWHFLSAIALFMSFLLLLKLNEELYTSSEKNTALN